MTSSCMAMAISDFYSAHPNYTTRLRPHIRHAESFLDADFAVLELLKHEQVHGVIGPQHSTEEKFVTELGQKVHVPIISFTARTLVLPDTENHYFVRTAIDDAVQTRALAAICKGFQWAEVVILYEETGYGCRFISHLSKALQDVEIGQVHLVAVPTSAKNSHLRKELSMLNEKKTGVFLVHMNPSLGFRLFALAQKVGMMSEGYSWIITDSVSNFLNSMDSVTRVSMEGVVGIRPYVPYSDNLEKFKERWTRNSMVQNKNRGQVVDLNAYGLWAYDTITALAIAVEKIGPVNSSSLYAKIAKNGTKHGDLRISTFGPRLLRELSSTKFRGLSGDFELVDGKLKPSAFEIFNVIGTGERRVGFWTTDGGIRRQIINSSDHDQAKTYSTSTAELKNIVWPGDLTSQPKGWLPSILRIGVPWKSGYKEFVSVTDIDPATNRTHNPTGFAIDIFNETLKFLPFKIKYEFYCYNETNNDKWTYDDMLHGIPRDFDMVVGDTTIWAPRASYVDFSLPYSESGVVLVVRNKKAFDMWIFTKPLRWDLWLAIGLACIFMGIVIWILERPVTNNPITPGEESVVKTETEQPGMNYLAPITVLAFPERNMVTNKWSLFVLVCWLFMAFILMQSFTANLSAILTVDQLKFAFSEDYYLGYQEFSFIEKFLTEDLNINKSRLKGYSSVEGFHDAMSRGSKNGGIDAIFDEIPYVKLLMNRYDSQYKWSGQFTEQMVLAL
ncbi:UNVERIFIED_CONTAM: Glutamate receptor 2.7 [Sesamum radiatum]|uniref:Glutamate receptor 2.7 n=1 Tax=Sesamum radiatum TaxID=300843 RepID=A0AAW2NC78_SESRA